MTNNNSKSLLFLNSCMVKYERPLGNLSGQSENDTEFNELFRLIKLSLNFSI